MLFVFHHPTGLPSALSLSFLSYRSEKSSLDYYTIKIHDKKNIIQFVETKKRKRERMQREIYFGKGEIKLFDCGY
jgi:hypothetical protein